MKKALILSLIMVTGLVSWGAAEGFLFYPNRDAVLKGGAITGSSVAGGILIPASSAMGGGESFVGSMTGPLYAAELVRLDMGLGVALIRVAGEVREDGLLSAHKNRAAGIAGFLPNEPAPTAETLGLPVSSIQSSTTPYLVLINGKQIGAEPIVLTQRFKKSKMKLELVKGVGNQTWKVSLRMTAEPKLSFWKEGQTGSLNNVPRPEFEFSHQSMFKPFRTGDKMAVGVEIFHIKQPEHVLTITVEDKEGNKSEVLARVQFEEGGKKKKK